MAELNFENRTLYHGDNLNFLRGMNSETVHLIATDPPFNKNRTFTLRLTAWQGAHDSVTDGHGSATYMRNGLTVSRTIGLPSGRS